MATASPDTSIDVDVLNTDICRQVSPGSNMNAAQSLSEHLEDDDDDLNWVANYESSGCSAYSLIPPLRWVPSYMRFVMGQPTTADKASVGALPYSIHGDFISGLTVGFMLVPQSLAFALLAGLPVQIGLYASFTPLVVYAMFGTIRQVQPGPTALMSLLTGQALDSMGYEDEESRIAGAVLLAFVCGILSILLGAVRFGFIVDFMSHSVMSAFCAAAGVTIASSQLKHIFGIDMDRQKYWWQTVYELGSNIADLDVPTFGLGASLLFVLILLKEWKGAGAAEKRRGHWLWRFFPTDKGAKTFRAFKMVADMSALLAVLIGWIWAYLYRQAGIDSVRLVGEVSSEGLTMVLPGKGVQSLKGDAVFTSASIMTVVGFLETMAVGGKFAAQARYNYDPNQELLALGLSNVASAFFSGYPVTGSFSRTAVNAMLGATSLWACALSSMIVVMAIYLLLPVIALLPLASLAPIIIVGAMGVIHVSDFKVAWRTSRAEFGVMIMCFWVCLALSVKEGLLVGFVLSILKTMNDLANPNLAVCGMLADKSFRDIRNFPHATVLPNAVFVRMDARLNFANARKLKEFCVRALTVRLNHGDDLKFLVIDAKPINHVDLTGCETLVSLAETLHTQGVSLILANLKGPVSGNLMVSNVPKAFAKNDAHLCIDMEQALAIVSGASPKDVNASVSCRELASRVAIAKHVLRASGTNHSMFCGASGNGLCSKQDDPRSPRSPTGASPFGDGTKRRSRMGRQRSSDSQDSSPSSDLPARATAAMEAATKPPGGDVVLEL
eukprot:TRINITY_DN11500_c0_g3_i1.p1 TRINITY_DN11500_c0_g3~~TRINITY_DN11500_c0_g3_i1.p1  ORF type:complete len:824 (-),score=79.07 TRINITY_DN11500_c0_g3_i1:211-2556(-)